MYGVILKDLYESSLMAEGGSRACWIFVSMIVHADKDDCVRTDPRLFARKIDVTQEELDRALAILTQPDPNSNLKTREGRRIVPLDQMPDIDGDRGWYVVNRTHYITLTKGQNSTSRVNKHRKKKEIENLFRELRIVPVSETLHPSFVTYIDIFISISISIEVIKEIVGKKIDLKAWTDYEVYRQRIIKKPLKTDRGRRRQISILEGLTPAQQQAVVQQTIDREWITLVPLQENGKRSSGGYVIGGETIYLPAMTDDKNSLQLANKLGVNLRGLSRQEAHDRLKNKLEQLEQEER